MTPPQTIEATTIIRALMVRGWRWSDADQTLLVHPEDHTLCLRYDPPTDHFTISPELDARLDRVIPTPASKGRFRG